MSIYGTWKTATITVATNATHSAEVDLGNDWDFLDIIIPSLTSCTLKLQAAQTTGGTFQDLGSGVTTPTTIGSYSDVWTLGGYRYVKVVSSASQGANETFQLRGWRR